MTIREPLFILNLKLSRIRHTREINADFDKLTTLIKDTDWDSKFLDAVDINQATENFTSTFLNHVRACVPKKSVTIRP
jgi:hypothetical protein